MSEKPIKLDDYRAARVMLDDLKIFLARFVSYPSPEALTAHTLWIAHTHCMAAWESTPRIAFLSPEPVPAKRGRWR